MIKNYVIVSYRNMNRNKIYSVITILGLAIGIMVCLLILLWVKDEQKFDKFHENSDRLSRVIVTFDGDLVAVTPAALAKPLSEYTPEIEACARFKNWGPWALQYQDSEFLNFRSGVLDQSGLDMFSFKFLSGDSRNALNDPHSLVLTQSVAKEIFMDKNPVGKVLVVKDLGDFTVTGVIEDVNHSHFNFEFLAPFEILKEFGENIDDPGSGSFNFTTYALLHKGVSIEEVNKKIKDFFPENGWDDIEEEIFLQPFEDIYLNSYFTYDFTIRGDSEMISFFTIIAFLVLLIACINFINLKTAKSQQRAKEVGLRKVIGAKRKQIVLQFLGESFFTSIIALLIALVGTELVLPNFNEFVFKELSISDVFKPSFLHLLFGITFFTGIFSGFYPAFYLSNLKPVNSLQNSHKSRKYVFRTLLVVIQFTLSSILLISAFTISNQLSFISTKDLGYQKHHLLFTNVTPTLSAKYEVLKERLLSFPQVESVSASRVLPVYECPSFSADKWEGNSDDRSLTVHNIAVDYDFLKTFGIKLLEGRSFLESMATDSLSFIVNETFLQETNMKDPIGKYFLEEENKIIGVIKDFHFNTVRSPIAPLIITLRPNLRRHILVRIQPGTRSDFIEKLNEILKNFDPDTPSDFHFFDHQLENLYRKEQNTKTLINWFSILAIFISCLGLYGLAAFLTEQRQKEIGIRKVLGANTIQLLLSLNLNFIKWVIFSNLLAFPISFYIMKKWLSNFAYGISFPYINLFYCFFITVIIASITSSFHTIRSSLQNPVRSLRYE